MCHKCPATCWRPEQQNLIMSCLAPQAGRDELAASADSTVLCEFSRATSKTRTNDTGISICRRLATFHLSLFSSPKSLRPAAPETLSPRHPHSSDPRDGAVECCGRRNSLRSDQSLVRAMMKQRDIPLRLRAGQTCLMRKGSPSMRPPQLIFSQCRSAATSRRRRLLEEVNIGNFSDYLQLGHKDRTGAPYWGCPLPFHPVRSVLSTNAPFRRLLF